MSRFIVIFFLTSLCSILFSSSLRSEVDSTKTDFKSIRSVSPSHGEQLFFVCGSCHSLSAGEEHKLGPNLYSIVDRPAATRDDYDYSEALKNSDIVWTRESLIAWIVSTETMVPGTFMLYENFLTGQEIISLVDYVIEQVDPRSSKRAD